MLNHLALLALTVSCASAIVLHPRDLDAQIQDTYDYVVVGCGIAGLVVSNRLSEDPNVSVLCLEAGLADNYEEFVLVPQFVGTDVGSQYDWKLGTTDQTFLDGNPRPLPQGKAVGGGSILNALIWHRGPREDYDAWEQLGNPGWNWFNLLPYFKKSETYTPDFTASDAAEFQISYTESAHGFDGPVHVAYPQFFYPQASNFFRGLNQAGIPTVVDPSDGTVAGAAFCPQDINPTNQTRSDARRSYLDPYITRPNFHVASQQQVTQILFDTPSVANPASNNPTTGGGNGNGAGSISGGGQGLFGVGSTVPPPISGVGPKLKERDHLIRRAGPPSPNLPLHRAVGVEFATNASSPRISVRARREVIVAAGASHSPQVLQLSGIGPAAMLQSFGIQVLVDLPGVGQNLQDHPLVGTFYPYNNVTISPAQLSTNATLNAQARAEYYAHKTGPWTHGAADAVAFPPLGLTTNRSSEMLANVAAQTPEQFLPPNTHPSIISGYAEQKIVLQELLANNRVPAYEIIPNDIGSLTVGKSVMHPFSRGTIKLRSNQPFDTPVIDPRWCANPFDKQVLLEALLFNRVLLATPAMLELQPAQFVPPIDASEQAIIDTINNGLRTEYHVSGSCIMLPYQLGGVVDSNLLVYGTSNVRVVDASMMPLVPAAHLQATVYAVAERISDIIKNANKGTPDDILIFIGWAEYVVNSEHRNHLVPAKFLHVHVCRWQLDSELFHIQQRHHHFQFIDRHFIEEQ